MASGIWQYANVLLRQSFSLAEHSWVSGVASQHREKSLMLNLVLKPFKFCSKSTEPRGHSSNIQDATLSQQQ